MRIIAGSARGTPLLAPKGMDTRPTQDKVKESLFNMLQGQLEDGAALDLFAGSGALGLEAVSRGASRAVLVDQSREAAQCIRRNIEKLRFQDRAELVTCDWKQAVSKLAREGRRFDLVFLDPPYQSGLLEEALDRLTRFDILNPHGIIVAEHPADRRLPPLPPPYRLRRTYRYGKIAVTLYRREPDQENEEQRS